MENLSGIRSAEYSEVIATTETGESVYVHPVGNKSGKITCTVICSTSSGKIQTTTSGKSEIEAGTATWQDWSNGTVTETTSDVITGSVTGIRGVSVSGEIIIEIVI